jgi:hypothetical protein
LVDFHEIQPGGHAVEGYLYPTFLNSVASTIPKWQAFKLLRWIQNLNHLT